MNGATPYLLTKVKMMHFRQDPKTTILPIPIHGKPTNCLKQYPMLKNTKPALSKAATIAPTRHLNAPLPMRRWHKRIPLKNQRIPYIIWEDGARALDLVTTDLNRLHRRDSWVTIEQMD